jgi:hypothetical protein
MAWSAGTITSATPYAALSQKIKDLISGGSGIANWSFVENIPAGTQPGQTGTTGYSIDVFRCRGAATLYKRLVQTNMVNGQDTTNTTSYVFTLGAAAPQAVPAASRFMIVAVVNVTSAGTDAADPTGVTMNGTNPPTFTKIKSQASGSSSPNKIIKATLWIGKTDGTFVAAGTPQITVSFGSTQQGCMCIAEQFEGCDLTLGADAVDGTGATKIGIQVVGNGGTTSPAAHSATLASYLGPQSIGYVVAAQTASGGTYTNGVEAGWTPTVISAGSITELSMATPATHMIAAVRPDYDDTSPTLTISSTTSMTDWVCIAFEFQRTTDATSVTNPNDAGKDWYFMLEIPTTDNGSTASNTNCAENYDLNKFFAGVAASSAAATPVLPNYRRDETLRLYNSATGNNRANQAHQTLNTTGFSYWIKITPNGILIATRVASAEATNGAMLLDSFVTNATDALPLIHFCEQAAGNVYTRLPGVTAANSAQWQITTVPWTTPVVDAFTTQAANAQDLWANSKCHAARVFSVHTPGRSTVNAITSGYGRGLWKTDYLCMNPGAGTIQLGDRLSIGTSNLTSGTLVTGKTYKIVTYVAGDDFTNVGGTNVTGNVFTATGTTPTTWTNGSTLIELNYVVVGNATWGSTGSIALMLVTKDT